MCINPKEDTVVTSSFVITIEITACQKRWRNDELCVYMLIYMLYQGLWSFCLQLALQSLRRSVMWAHAGCPEYLLCTANVMTMTLSLLYESGNLHTWL